MIVDIVGVSFYAACVLVEELSHQHTQKGEPLKFLKILSSGSGQLDTLYSDLVYRNIERLSPEAWFVLCEILLALLLSVEQMTLKVVVRALQAENRAAQPDNIVKTYDIEDIRHLLTSSAGMASITSDYVKLPFPFINYLRSGLLSAVLRYFPLTDSAEAQLHMARKCILAMDFHLNENSATVQTLTYDSLRHTFKGYAVVNWIHHYLRSQDVADEGLQNSAYNLLYSTRTDDS
jgi:hypothetical protein